MPDPLATAAKPQSRSEQKFQAIVDAAEQVFIRLGYQKTSMDKIADTAKVSKRTVYNHFATKDDLFYHILNLCVEDIFSSTSLPYDPARSLHDQLTQLLSSEWDTCASDRLVKLTRVVIAEYVTTPGFIEQFIAELKQREDGLKKWLKAAISDERLKPMDLEYGSDFLTGSIKTFSQDPQLFDQSIAEGEERAFIINEIVSMFLLRYSLKD